ncbi:MAG: diaminopimelate decarboxylase [Proteobacteria bacterium]|nr:MAG: diaminopimelate decarboxylase [Pseudomonadota bacterium]
MALLYKNGSLFFGEKPCDILAIAKARPSPFYLYDLDGMRARARKLKECYPGIEIHYATKANGSNRVLSTFRSEGTGVDVVSGGEIRRAFAAGFRASDVIFSGVGKTRDELTLAMGLGIKQINVESPQELVRIVALAKASGQRPRIAFRVNPDVDAKTHPYITTGFRENKFGMGENFYPELKEILRSAGNAVELVGLTLHIGSQLQDLQPLEDAIGITLKAYRAFQADGFKMQTLDVGGGLGINYKDGHTNPSRDYALLDGYAAMLQRALKGFDGRLLCEPGRILVGSSGTLVGEVQYVKETPFRNFLIVNTGMHHLMRPALYQAQHRILPLVENADRQIKRYDVVGPICESSDVIGRDREFPEVRQDEFIAIADAGAYGYSMASNYNDHALPEEYFWEKGELTTASGASALRDTKPARPRGEGFRV